MERQGRKAILLREFNGNRLVRRKCRARISQVEHPQTTQTETTRIETLLRATTTHIPRLRQTIETQTTGMQTGVTLNRNRLGRRKYLALLLRPDRTRRQMKAQRTILRPDRIRRQQKPIEMALVIRDAKITTAILITQTGKELHHHRMLRSSSITARHRISVRS
jgi:hypothetical protein